MISKKRGKRTYSKNIKRKYSKNKKRKYSKKRKIIHIGGDWNEMIRQQKLSQIKQLTFADKQRRKLENAASMMKKLNINLSNHSGKEAQFLSNRYQSMPKHPLFEITKELIPQVISKRLGALWPLSEIIDLQVKYLNQDDIVQLNTIEPLYSVLSLQFQQLKKSNDDEIRNPRSIEPLNSVLTLQITKLHTITPDQYGLEQLEPLNSVLTLQFIKLILPKFPSSWVESSSKVWKDIFPLGIIYKQPGSSGRERTNYKYFVNWLRRQSTSVATQLRLVQDPIKRINILQRQKLLKDILDYQFDNDKNPGISDRLEPLKHFVIDMRTILQEKKKKVDFIIQSLSEKNKDEINDSLAGLPPQVSLEFLEYWLNISPLPTAKWNFTNEKQVKVKNDFYVHLNNKFDLLAKGYSILNLPPLNYILDQSPDLYNSYALSNANVVARLNSVSNDMLSKYLLALARAFSSAPPGRTPTPQEPLYSVIKAQLKILNINPSEELFNQQLQLKRVLEIQTEFLKNGISLETLYPLNYMFETFDAVTLSSLSTIFQPIPKNGGGGRVNKNIKLKKKIDLLKEIKKNKYLIGGRKTLKQDSLPKSPCKGETADERCDDSEYLKILSGMSTIQTNNITQHLLMRLHSPPILNDAEISSLMPYIEIILDGIHDFKQYFTKAQFINYCVSISNDQFQSVACSSWLSEIYDSFAEDNLFVPLVKTNSAELIKNGEIFVYNENIDEKKEAHKTEILNLYISRDIWGGTKHDAGRGLSHIKSLALALSNSSSCPIDDDTHPKSVLKSLSTIIDPSPPTSLNLDATFKTTSRNDINDIYDGYFDFFNEKLSGYKIRFKEYLDTKCKRVRFAIYLEQEFLFEEGWKQAKNNLGDNMTYNNEQQIWLINTSVDNVETVLASYYIFLCNSGTYSTFTINNIQYSLKKFEQVIGNKQFVSGRGLTMQWFDEIFKKKVDGYKNATHDPILFKFFCIMYLKFKDVRANPSLFIRLGLTFKLIGDRGQAWWVWKYNQNYPDRKIILSTGDRMLMIFAISIGIPAVWSAQGKEYGFNYYYFPNNDSFDVQMVTPTLPSDLKLMLYNYKTISAYDNNSVLDTILEGIQSVRILTPKETKEILYNSCWRFVETTLPINIINESRSGSDQPYDIFLAFLQYTLKMDPFRGRKSENKIIYGLVQKTVGKYLYKEENKVKSVDDFYKHIAAGQTLTIEQFLEVFITKFLPFQFGGRKKDLWVLGSLFKIKPAKLLMQKVLEWNGEPYEFSVEFPYKAKLLNKIKNIVLSNIKELYIKHINRTIDDKLERFIQGHTIQKPDPTSPSLFIFEKGNINFQLNLTKLDGVTPLPIEEFNIAYTKFENDNNYLRKTIKKALIIWASKNAQLLSA